MTIKTKGHYKKNYTDYMAKEGNTPMIKLKNLILSSKNLKE